MFTIDQLVISIRKQFSFLNNNITSIKNNRLKLKNEVGMAVLKSKQTRVVASYIEIISTYVYSTSLRLLFRLVRLCDTTILLLFTNIAKVAVYSVSKRRDVLYTYVLIISI